jgi:putative pyruvate formate lyase activating enzyme
MGHAVSTEEFARICRTLEEMGAENINIVTGSHAIPAIAAGIDAARATGLHIPVLWNTSSYETPEALELLHDRIDTFLPDLKTLDSDIAGRFFNAPDYPRAAEAAIRAMMDITGKSAAPGERMCRVIIRHLILPGFLESTRQVLKWFADNASGRALLSLMTQYTPPAETSLNAALPASIPLRYVNESEYDTVIEWLDEFGINDGYCQELVTGSDWLPDFNRVNPFSSELSKPVWHWREGFGG